ncbi:MAG: endolytic transglycosylase MltG [Acidimicrobiales bacterium]
MSGPLFDGGEAVPPPRPRRPQRAGRVLWALGAVLVVVVLGLGVAALWVQRQIDPPGDPGERVSVMIPDGATTTDIAHLLADEGVVSDGRIFRYFVIINGGGPFQAGRYELRESSAMGDVVEALGEGPQLTSSRLTVPEGITLKEVAAAVDDVEWLSGERFLEAAGQATVRSRFQAEGTTSLEGLLFPETYEVDETQTETRLLQRMVDTFDSVAGELGYDDAVARTGLSPYETVIVASLIEAEAKVDDDRAKIGRVIYNRLQAEMSLGIDATVYYALGRRGGSLTRSDLAVDSPYNTRSVVGLPPTPIAIPGRASLEAALNPEPGPWLYFVLTDERGVHSFSEDFGQFQRDREEARRKGLI